MQLQLQPFVWYKKFMIWLFYTLQIFLVIFLVAIIMLQKSSDNIFATSKIFGMRGRSNAIIKLTYFLCGLFFVNCLILGAFYQKKYKEEAIKEIAPLQTEKAKNSK